MSSRARIWIALGALLLAVAAVVVIVLLSGSGSNPGAAYRARLRSVLAPVVAANETLSNQLKSLHGRNIAAASTAATQAEQALLTARGAVAVLTVPDGLSQLSQQAQQALTDENGYLQGVNETLSAPSSDKVSQLQPLVTSTQSALVPLEGVAPEATASLSGTNGLSSWASGQVAAAVRAAAARSRAADRRAVQQAAVKAARQAVASQPVLNNSNSASTVSPSGIGVQDLPDQCGGGIAGTAGVTCAFAENAFFEYWSASGGNPTLFESISAWSAEGQAYYSLSCSSGDGVVDCSGYNGSGVSIDARFNQSAVLAYPSTNAASYAASGKLGP
jgi:hypothetical protein